MFRSRTEADRAKFGRKEKVPEMLDEASLRTAMADVGYQRVKRHVYRAAWSTPDVEHFIFFLVYGAPKDYLAADFGFRNKEAQAFALKVIQKYGGDVYQLMKHDQRIHCPMRFSLGRLASWGLRSSLRISDISGIDLALKVKLDIVERLFPLVRNVLTLDGLFSLLLADTEPYPWVRCNGAIRAAKIVQLARQLGIQTAKIREILRPYSKHIASALLKATNPSPDSYVERILEDSVAAQES